MLKEVKDDCVEVACPDGAKRSIKTDTVVMAVGYAPRREIFDRLRSETAMDVYAIGDCVVPGKIFDAVHTAYKTAMNI